MLLLLSILFLSDEVLIYHTNDIHAGFTPTVARWMNPDFPPPLGRGASLSKLLEKSREKNPCMLLLDAGNFMPETFFPQDIDWEGYMEMMNFLSYDAAAIGVSELSYGLDVLDSMSRISDFPFISANLRTTETSRDLFVSYRIYDREEARIGVFGLISERTSLMLRRSIREKVIIFSEVETARKVVEELKDRGVDIIIAITSIGFLQDKKLAREVPGIDIIIGGYTGWARYEPYEDPVTHTLIVRLHPDFSSVGRFVLRIDPTTKRISNYDYKTITLLSEEYPTDSDFIHMFKAGN